MADIYLGIDLGTTESTVSVIEIDSIMDEPLDKLRDLSIYQYNAKHIYDKDLKGLQSSIYIDRDNKKVYTGEYAKVLYANGNKPLNTIRSIKTRIGGESMIQVPLESDKNNFDGYDMTELSALLLRTIKESVDSQISGKVEGVTITIPAGFNSDERNETIKAAEMGGFKHIHLLDEPTAVMLNFLNSKDIIDSIDEGFFDTSKNILVYDIGGGTLDISIAKISEDKGDFNVDILGRSKRMDFGGDDIDKYLASYFLSEFERINPSIDERTIEDQAKIVSRIVSNAEIAKKEFSINISKYLDKPRRKERIKQSVNFEIIDGLKITDITLKDDSLKMILSSVLSDYGDLLNPLRNSLQESKIKKEDLDLVILTGGSGKFYLVEETLKRFLGDDINIVDFTENNAVSRGAVIHSHNQTNEDLKKINISDIMSNSVFIRNGNSFDLLIPHDAETESGDVYEYVFDRLSNRLEVFLYYGSENEDKSKFKEIVGVFKELPTYHNKGDKVELKWEFDENKVISIYFEDEILINTSNTAGEYHELIDTFLLNPLN